jgi:predicted DNA-binding transcriptional regulator YafY
MAEKVGTSKRNISRDLHTLRSIGAIGSTKSGLYYVSVIWGEIFATLKKKEIDAIKDLLSTTCATR